MVRVPTLVDGVCRTAEDGTYLLELVPTREMYGVQGGGMPVLYVSAPGRVTHEQRLERLPPDTPAETVDVALKRGLAARGRVVDGARAPIEGAQVTLVTFARRPGGGFAVFQRWQLRTGAEGWFEADGLRTDLERFPPGGTPTDGHALHVFAERWGQVVMELPQWRSADERVDLGDIALPEPATLRGEVVDELGRPVAGADVGVVSRWEERMRLCRPEDRPSGIGDGLARTTLTTDDLGRFAAAGLPPGEVAVTARCLGIHRRVEETVTLSAGEERRGLRLALPGGETIEGVVQTADGEPVAGALVYVRDGGRGGASVETDADGRFRAEGLAEGRYLVLGSVKSVQGQPPTHLNDGLEDVPAGTSGLVLTVRRAVDATGVVLGAGDEPVAGRHIELSSSAYWRSFPVYTDEQGRFRAALPEGIAFDLVVKPASRGGGPGVVRGARRRRGSRRARSVTRVSPPRSPRAAAPRSAPRPPRRAPARRS